MDKRYQSAGAGAVFLAVIAGAGVVFVSSTAWRIAFVFAEAFVLIAAGIILAKLTPRK